MAVTDRILRRRPPVRPGPVKPKPKGKGRNPQLPYRSADPGFGPKKRNPGKGNPPVDKTLPRRYKPGEGFGKKRPLPVKPGPRNKEKELLYKVKPGEKLQKGFAGRSLNKEQMRKDDVKRPNPIQFSGSQKVKGFDKAKYEQMIQRGAISIMRRPDLDKNKLQSMTKGYRSAPDNSKVTYKTRVTPKGPKSMMEGPYRIKNTTVKTGRGR